MHDSRSSGAATKRFQIHDHAILSWTTPFVVFMLVLAATPLLHLHPRLELAVRFALPAIAILVCSRHLVRFDFARPLASIAIGILVFTIWVAPDVLFPNYRQHWLFQNSFIGTVTHSVNPASFDDPLNLALRVARASLVVPIAEELFWRGFVMRWLINHHFEEVPLGVYGFTAFWVTTLLFGIEHGPFWEVGLVAGAVYNYWMVRVKRISDLILAHAATNFCLALFVFETKRWEFWM